jgi:signal transduction histidine kinase
MARIKVDTHLFQELGDLLVGRDSTALIELIKNSYDADATEATVYGEALDNVEEGFILVRDNGNGMTPEEFQEGFLTVASRSKNVGERRSEVFERKYTGEKGVGRLAAHKLSKVLEVHSIPRKGEDDERKGVDAKIDWDIVEEKETIEHVNRSDEAIEIEEWRVEDNQSSGTTIKLSRLRRPWSKRELGSFLDEVQTFKPPEPLSKPLPSSAVEKPLLFESPQVRDADTEDEGFEVNLEGAFDPGDTYWQSVVDAAKWIVEIHAGQEKEEVRYCITPTKKALDKYPGAEQRNFSVEHPDPEGGPFFDARILVRPGQADNAAWEERASGIRVYMEGFRVLPYGETGNDWLDIDSDYAKRSANLDSRFEPFFEGDHHGHTVLPNRSYFGAVFLTQEKSRKLRMVVNREGFVPEEGFYDLKKMVKDGVNLVTRVRGAERARIDSRSHGGEESGKERSDSKIESDSDDQESTEETIADSAEKVHSLAKTARESIDRGEVEDAEESISEIVNQADRFKSASEELISERSMLRVMASLGTQFTAFVHEIDNLVSASQSIDETLKVLRKPLDLNNEQRNQFAQLQRSIRDLRRSLERQAAYLMDIVTPDARRRRSRQYLRDRFESGRSLVESQVQKRSIEVENRIPEDLKVLPMFPAELTAVFANLLTNAVKAAGEKGRILAYAERNENGSISLIVENTGESVDLEDSEKWFRPFESTTSEVNPVLGQGMGLGLPITRDILEEYGASIEFVEPDDNFATAIEVQFPDK